MVTPYGTMCLPCEQKLTVVPHVTNKQQIRSSAVADRPRDASCR